MIRALSILAAVAALAVSTAPVASSSPWYMPLHDIHFGVKAAPPKPPQAMSTRSGGEVEAKRRRPGTNTKALTGTEAGADGYVANHTEGTIRGLVGGRYGDGKFGGD